MFSSTKSINPANLSRYISANNIATHQNTPSLITSRARHKNASALFDWTLPVSAPHLLCICSSFAPYFLRIRLANTHHLLYPRHDSIHSSSTHSTLIHNARSTLTVPLKDPSHYPSPHYTTRQNPSILLSDPQVPCVFFTKRVLLSVQHTQLLKKTRQREIVV